jgi:hypothetical protein
MTDSCDLSMSAAVTAAAMESAASMKSSATAESTAVPAMVKATIPVVVIKIAEPTPATPKTATVGIAVWVTIRSIIAWVTVPVRIRIRVRIGRTTQLDAKPHLSVSFWCSNKHHYSR